MQYIDTFWEKRNLGVDSCEVRFSPDDTWDDYKAFENKIDNNGYAVVKLPSGRADLMALIQEKGFTFAETAISLKLKKRAYTVPDRIKRLLAKCSCILMTSADIDVLYAEIDKGIFNTDRIYMDKRFPKGTSARRYKNWIGDLVEQGNIPYKIQYAGSTIGFIMVKRVSEDTWDGILAGAYSDYLNTGMGAIVQYMGPDTAFKEGAEFYLGHVSACNPAVLKILLSCGYQVTDIDYVFIRHNP